MPPETRETRRDPIAPPRIAAAMLALGAGLPAMAALVSGLADPPSGKLDFALAGLFLAIGCSLGLALRLRHERAKAAALVARIEALQDHSWELSDIESRRTADAVVPIATVSHEMRAPLHGMLALTDLLAATPLTEEQSAYLAALNQSAGALARLVDDLLDASRIATGQFSLSPGPLDVETLAEGVAELLAPIAHERGVGIGTRVAAGLPPVVTDSGRLRQVLINLVANAIEATEQGSVLLAVDPVDDGREGGLALSFAVHDSGRGIAEADRERIFSSFERAGAGGSGLGLGLAISQQIVGRMGGAIAAEPRVGGGTVFHFTLPLSPIGPAPRAARPLEGVAVLVAAPAGLEAEALVAALEEAGAEARLAGSLVEAAGLLGAAAAAGQPYRMVLADGRIASDARAALRRLREASGRAIAVAILVDSRERRAAETLKADGFDAYLIRPVRRRSLVAVIGAAIRRPDRFVADPASSEERLPPPRRGTRPATVLVVEDDPVSALLARAVLERLGHEVDEARSQAAARQRMETPPDAALIDLRLADGDALALIRDLAALPGARRPALIATSGSVDPAARQAALAAGADLFLEKPVSAERLCRAFEEALNRRSKTADGRHQTA